MKTLTLTCKDCSLRREFQGRTAIEVIDRIDNSGWDHSAPTLGLCPECWTKHDNDGREPE